MDGSSGPAVARASNGRSRGGGGARGSHIAMERRARGGSTQREARHSNIARYRYWVRYVGVTVLRLHRLLENGIVTEHEGFWVLQPCPPRGGRAGLLLQLAARH